MAAAPCPWLSDRLPQAAGRLHTDVTLSPLEAYLSALAQNRASGTTLPETSGYPALANLLTELGQSLRPKVTALIQLANSGAGMPDGGLFLPEQLRRSPEDAPLRGLQPARGILEVKTLADDLDAVAQTKQVRDYVKHYGQALLTNYRAFVQLRRGPDGQVVTGERYVLADSEAAFWSLAAHPRKAAAEHGERLADYLKRALLAAAPLDNPRDLAFFLASYARDARHRIEHAPMDALLPLRTALETALGLRVEGERGLHFFRSTLVQTLFYGVFSAWVLWHKEKPGRTDRFDWKTSAFHLRLPVLRALFHALANPAHLSALDLSEPLDWAADVLARVERPAFFARFAEHHAVQYFYEPFLEAFDPQLREDFGVWYTPDEIVRYMVARVDQTLREQFGLAAGLADESVVVLDPCCGTGAYLVEVLRAIHRYHKEEGGLGSIAAVLTKQAAQTRIFGFELLPAPYVVAHLELGLLLQELEAPLNEAKEERAAVYLTNALTGWTPTKEPKLSFMKELDDERDAANAVKWDRRILVVLGNPPYKGHPGVAVGEERDLSTVYRKVKHPACPKPDGRGLNELYVRFFRMAERQIAESKGEGIVCFIANNSWLGGTSHPGMREQFLNSFDEITIDCLNGDSRETGKLTPEGEPDPSVFSTEHNREGIQVGTAIALLVRRSRHKEAHSEGPKLESGSRKEDQSLLTSAPTGLVRFRHFWGKTKREDLLASLTAPKKHPYQRLKPEPEQCFWFLPTTSDRLYLNWPKLTDLLSQQFAGIQTSRDDALVSIEREVLVTRLKRYFDPDQSNQQIAAVCSALWKPAFDYDPVVTRAILLKQKFEESSIRRFAYRPFDMRWLFWESSTSLLHRASADYVPHVFAGNLSLVTQRKSRREWQPPQVISAVGCLDLMDRGASYFPMFLREEAVSYEPAVLRDTPELFSPGDMNGGGGGHTDKPKPNLSPKAAVYLAKLGAKPESLFFHLVATLHAPAYRQENAGALRQDWPRIPLPASRAVLEASAKLGQELAALLDSETPVAGVTKDKFRPELKRIASMQGTDLEITAGWGIAGKGGIVMPGKGRLTEVAPPADRPAALGTSPDLNVWLNASTCWTHVPAAVWDYTLGGYPVLKKWLSYREAKLLGRPLAPEEAVEFTRIARRIAAILLLGPALDTSYAAVKADAERSHA